MTSLIQPESDPMTIKQQQAADWMMTLNEYGCSLDSEFCVSLTETLALRSITSSSGKWTSKLHKITKVTITTEKINKQQQKNSSHPTKEEEQQRKMSRASGEPHVCNSWTK